MLTTPQRHCTSDSDSATDEPICEKQDRDYNISLRIGMVFVMLATSAIGVFGPILISSFVAPTHIAFTILRQFGTGIIISTAFVHLFTHAQLMFANKCLGRLQYESTASAILMAGLFLSFLVEYIGVRVVQWHGAKTAASSTEEAKTEGTDVNLMQSGRTEMVNIAVLEAGVIFHSFCESLSHPHDLVCKPANRRSSDWPHPRR